MLALLPPRPFGASRDVPRLPHILPSEVIERKKETLQACLRNARDSVLGLGLTSNRSSVVSDRFSQVHRFQNVRKRLCAGFTTQRDHLLYPHTGSLQY
jgi:hypothetical protein